MSLLFGPVLPKDKRQWPPELTSCSFALESVASVDFVQYAMHGDGYG